MPATIATAALALCVGCSAAEHASPNLASANHDQALPPVVDRVVGAGSVSVNPRHPQHGRPTYIHIGGRLRGGKYAYVQTAFFGDRSSINWLATVSCVAGSERRSVPARMHDYDVHVTHTWKRAGVYTVKVLIGPLCPLKNVVGTTAKFRIHVT